MALAYATADRGATTCGPGRWWPRPRRRTPWEGKARLVKDLQDRNAALWTLIGCDNIPANTTGDPAKFVEYSIKGLGILAWTSPSNSCWPSGNASTT